jgi:lipid-A-disaccharide synthase
MSDVVYFVATEASGDLISAEVMDEISRLRPGTIFKGVGGAQMENRGVQSLFDTQDLAVFGLIEGVKAFKTVKKRVEETAKDIVTTNPSAVVLVDSWGFMWRVAKRAKELGYTGPCIKLIGPQVWATRPKRAKRLAQHVDHLLCIHDFETPFYEPYGLATTVIGNPALARNEAGYANRFREKYSVPSDRRLLLMMLGSRNSELQNVAPILEETGASLCRKYKNLQVVCVAAASVVDQIRSKSTKWKFPNICIYNEKDKTDAIAVCDVALACSGTVTTEIAMQGVPLVIGYKIGWLSWAIARATFLLKSKYITLFNVAANEEIAPEFIQTRLRESLLTDAVSLRLDDENLRTRQIEKQNAALEKMGRGGKTAANISAETILKLI